MLIVKLEPLRWLVKKIEVFMEVMMLQVIAETTITTAIMSMTLVNIKDTLLPETNAITYLI